MRRSRRLALGVLAVSLVVAVVAWTARDRIVTVALDRFLAQRHVRASFAVRDIGLRWQRIENVRIGDPDSPDLTADWIEVQMVAGRGGPFPRAVRAGGVRINARWDGRRLHLGDLDRLIPANDAGAPFTLPEIDLQLRDAQLRLASPYGPSAFRLDGAGNLSGGFGGTLALAAPGWRIGSCRIDVAKASLRLAVTRGSVRASGPLQGRAVACGKASVATPELSIDAELSPQFDRWRGTAGIRAQDGRWGDASAAGVTGKVQFAGSAAGTGGTIQLSSPFAAFGRNRLDTVAIAGRFSTIAGGSIDLTARAGRARLDPRLLQPIVASRERVSGTPLAPLAGPFASAAEALVREGASLRLRARVSGGTVTVSRIDMAGPNGLSATLGGGNGLQFGSAGFSGETSLALSGAGLPAVTVEVRRRADGKTSGIARVAPFARRGARIVLAPISFAARPSGAMLFESAATLDGPVSTGSVRGLHAPVAIYVDDGGAILVNRGCTRVSLQSLSLSSVRLGAGNASICPEGAALLQYCDGRFSGGGRVSGPVLRGRVSASPFIVSARRAAFSLADLRFGAEGLQGQIGPAERISRIAGNVSGGVSAGGAAGRFANVSGDIGGVPLNLSGGSGTWRFGGGALSLDGAADITDRQSAARFSRLSSDDLSVRIASGTVRAHATLLVAGTKHRVTGVSVQHDLARGAGNAILDVTSLTFGRDLQPEAVTPLTLGVIANVEGTITGQGRIDWNGQGVTSRGRFATEKLDFAAAFGPVSGLSGTIMFDDLLALSTPPAQTVRIAAINPGTAVTDGVLRYRLLPGQRIAVESGRWPFAGGQLLLDPTLLDLGKPSARLLTFRIVALDAARFIERFQFENLAATGTFDGTIPMIFDENGGRIENGRIVARRGGGTLAYVGQVSNADMNVFAKLAFDALKSIRYDNLSIDLDGPLDGEMVSRVDFTGINERPRREKRGFLARQFANLPFRFNIVIRAPFRGLLSTAKTFQDPGQLLRRVEPLPPAPGSVQPSESESRP